MSNVIPAWIRVPMLFLIIVGITEYYINSGKQFAFIEYPILLPALLVVLLYLISVETIVGAVEKTLLKTLTPEAKRRYMLEQQKRSEKYSLNRWFKQMTYAPPEELDLELNHNYDGIKELDNKLPPWWLYSFYATIIFAFGYMAYYHILDGDNQLTEFEKEMASAQISVEEYKQYSTDLIDVENVIVLTEDADVKAGNTLYQINCIACHAADGGGGIGPNLADQHWILGGGIKNIFSTISEGGRAGKGMIAWKSTLSPSEIQQISSYILTLERTTPASPKMAEGDIWVSE